MSSAGDIQVVSHQNLERIENFLKDASYKETIEFSASFNTRLGLERRHRLPFIDPQTGVAQNHSQLFMDKRQRMPGFRQGQIYSYPSARWRKSRRQYLNKMYRFPERPFQSLRKDHEAHAAQTAAAANMVATPTVNALNFNVTAAPTPIVGISHALDVDFSMSLHDESSSLGAIGGDTSDSKDSQQQPHQHQQSQQHKDDLPKEWFYDDMDMNDMDSLEEPKSPADDEYDYDPRYGTKKRRKRIATRKRAGGGSSGGGAGGAGGLGGESVGPGRRRARARADTSLDISMESIDGNGSANDVSATPTKSAGRRPRGSGGPRGRRRSTKNVNLGNANCDQHNPAMHAEPPSFDSVAAAVRDQHNELRNYRKYL